MLVENALNIYTDGSSFSKPRRGGIGVLFVQVDATGIETLIESTHIGYAGASNNQMELQACIAALEEAQERGLAEGLSKIVIHSDSTYVVNNVNSAIFSWPTNRWHTRDGTPVLNAEQWKKLTRLIKSCSHRVYFKWVKGHSKDQHNRAVDKAARNSAKSVLNPPLSTVAVRRKRTQDTVRRGSVEMIGQRLTIRVLTTEWLRTQKVWKVMYEVISQRSPYRGKVDIAFSDTVLSAGHTYFVKMGDNTKNPRVVRVYHEVA